MNYNNDYFLNHSSWGISICSLVMRNEKFTANYFTYPLVYKIHLYQCNLHNKHTQNHSRVCAQSFAIDSFAVFLKSHVEVAFKICKVTSLLDSMGLLQTRAFCLEWDKRGKFYPLWNVALIRFIFVQRNKKMGHSPKSWQNLML